MRASRSVPLLVAMAAGLLASTAAEAAPRILFKGCAYWRLPLCLAMKATDGKTYQLLDAGPAFPPNYPVVVYANPAGDVGTCLLPVAKVVRWRAGPPGPC